ncbi:Bli-4-like alcohol dehydrogenase [Apiospora phragmitis]|uniref:Bli-4-like alcohol dehydrogenase n=1 Tax=Apiospora phragmitis TaxID=2905665 RepID=A0ABR1WW58_9PEZI
MATSKGIEFSPDTDIPSLKGKVILITGANSGLGKQASLELAKHSPAMIYMAARSPEKGKEAIAEVQSQVPNANVSFLEMDLSSFASIKKAAKSVLDSSPRLDILMLNAGPTVMGCPPNATAEGYEIQMGTNHVGHALLLKLLNPLLRQTTATTAGTPARVVSMASSAWKHAGPEKIQFETLRDPFGAGAVTPVRRYIQSKTANMLYARALANRNMMVRPVSEGVKNQLWAATAPAGDVVSGAHYEPVGYRPEPSGVMLDEELGEKVWE